MSVIGLSFRSIEGKREKPAIKGEIKVNSAPRIKEMKEVTVPTLNKKALSMSFEFITSYSPEIAEIKISGEILYMGKSNATVLKQWKKDKKLPPSIGMEVINHLFRKCLLKISNIAEDLQLPPPLQIPRIKPQSQEASYIG